MAATIEAVFKDGSNKAYTQTVNQFDHKLSIHISGILLPEKFQAHFANAREGEIAAIVKGENYMVRIPDVYLQKGEYVYCWICVEKVSICQIVIPVARRPLVYQMNDGDDESEKTYAFTMPEDETLAITTVDEDEAPVDPIQHQGGWVMNEEGTIEYKD